MAILDTRTAPQNPETTSINSGSTVDADKGKYHLDNRIRTVLDANSTTLERVQAVIAPIEVTKDVVHDIRAAARSARELADGNERSGSATGRITDGKYYEAFSIPPIEGSNGGRAADPQARVLEGRLNSASDVPQKTSPADKRAKVSDAMSYLANGEQKVDGTMERDSSLDPHLSGSGATSRVTESRLEGAFEDPRRDKK